MDNRLGDRGVGHGLLSIHEPGIDLSRRPDLTGFGVSEFNIRMKKCEPIKEVDGGNSVMVKCAKPRRKVHAEAILTKDSLSDDEKDLVFQNWPESVNQINGATGAFCIPLPFRQSFPSMPWVLATA